MQEARDHNASVSQFCNWLIERRMPPQRAIRKLIESRPRVEALNFQVVFLECALLLDELYDEVCHSEWNDWQRVDYWKISSYDHEWHEGSAGLLEMKSELYRAIALLAGDLLYLDRQQGTTVRGSDVIKLWEERGSGYF